MSDISTTYGPNDVLVLGDAQPVLGTAMLGDAFGVIKRATLRRTAKRVEIVDDAETVRLVLLKNPGFEMTLECCFDADVAAPGLMEPVDLPLVGVTGRVMEGLTVLWEEGGERMLSIPLSQWDSLDSATAYRLETDGSTLHTL